AAGAAANEDELTVAATRPDPLVSEEAPKFLSFQPPQRSAIPTVHHRELVRSPIDASLLEKLEAKNLTFAPEANPLALMRRVYFDLVGLPPAPEEVKAYLKDTRPEAYERMVDRLLASPHFGDRWGKYWLD